MRAPRRERGPPGVVVLVDRGEDGLVADVEEAGIEGEVEAGDEAGGAAKTGD